MDKLKKLGSKVSEAFGTMTTSALDDPSRHTALAQAYFNAKRRGLAKLRGTPATPDGLFDVYRNGLSEAVAHLATMTKSVVQLKDAVGIVGAADAALARVIAQTYSTGGAGGSEGVAPAAGAAPPLPPPVAMRVGVAPAPPPSPLGGALAMSPTTPSAAADANGAAYIAGLNAVERARRDLEAGISGLALPNSTPGAAAPVTSTTGATLGSVLDALAGVTAKAEALMRRLKERDLLKLDRDVRAKKVAAMREKSAASGGGTGSASIDAANKLRHKEMKLAANEQALAEATSALMRDIEELLERDMYEVVGPALQRVVAAQAGFFTAAAGALGGVAGQLPFTALGSPPPLGTGSSSGGGSFRRSPLPAREATWGGSGGGEPVVASASFSTFTGQGTAAAGAGSSVHGNGGGSGGAARVLPPPASTRPPPSLPAAPAPLPPATAPEPPGTLYVAAYSFVPNQSDELPLKAGQTVFLIQRHLDGWATVEDKLSGAKGLVPLNYLRPTS